MRIKKITYCETCGQAIDWSDEEWKKMYVLPVNIMKNAISPNEK